MEGGFLINQGVDTCVFGPPVMCKSSKTVFNSSLYISRIVQNSQYGEGNIQQAFQITLQNLNQKLQASFSKHLLFASQICEPEFRAIDFYKRCIQYSPDVRYKNLITRKFKTTLGDLFKTQKNVSRNTYLSFLIALFVINLNQCFVGDLHPFNVGISDGNLVAFDFGRSFVPSMYSGNALEVLAAAKNVADPNVLLYLPNTYQMLLYVQTFAQNKFLCRMIAKAYKLNISENKTRIEYLQNPVMLQRLLYVFDTLQFLSTLYYYSVSPYLYNNNIWKIYSHIERSILDTSTTIDLGNILKVILKQFPL